MKTLKSFEEMRAFLTEAPDEGEKAAKDKESVVKKTQERQEQEKEQFKTTQEVDMAKAREEDFRQKERDREDEIAEKERDRKAKEAQAKAEREAKK